VHNGDGVRKASPGGPKSQEEGQMILITHADDDGGGNKGCLSWLPSCPYHSSHSQKIRC
jgi:hypothetical protein